MVRGRTTAEVGLVLGHEITGEVIEVGRDVETLKVGDLVSVPFNVACGRCPTCKAQHTGVCLNVNPSRAGGAYGYVDMGGWIGGQAEYVHGAVRRLQSAEIPRPRAGDVENPRPDVSVRHSADRLSRRGDGRREAGRYRLYCGRGAGGDGGGCFGALAGRSLHDRRRYERGASRACSQDAVSRPSTCRRTRRSASRSSRFSASPKWIARSTASVSRRTATAAAAQHEEAPATVLNSLMEITRAAGAIGIPGLYVTDDPGATDAAAEKAA